ncbi:KEOPS complex subunit Pcc1 [Candidatus Halobonum tyrrellensis]|uniref:KEOPS complex Pcc1-like subunit n=1 Tax=Candidatus Halobonum tyrrellensis G22 TaxID=1324957 RepID=V4HAT5_9EURY|nr:KEOPS complex subunit Pcc1 [Candidatus Halobonum tyrrellensis]ESP87173.1 hypothetical protein K933_15630 [Candidatus Halobonum tyrrellensis G22]
MSGPPADGDGPPDGTADADGRSTDGGERRRTATFETRHADPAAAATVAAALRPDNTAQIRTEADGTTVRTRVERDRTGGLQSSADDYLVNLAVAEEVVASARETTAAADDAGTVDAGTDDAETNRETRTDADADANTDTDTQ